MMVNLEVVEAELRLHSAVRKDLPGLAKELSDDVLVKLLNSKWNRVGDYCYEELGERTERVWRFIAAGYLEGLYTRYVGRLRALNFLKSKACREPLAKQCYRRALDDPKLALSGIYGVVYSIDVEALPKIREMLTNDPPENLKKYLVMAKAALAEKNPRLFKTGHRVDGSRWGW